MLTSSPLPSVLPKITLNEKKQFIEEKSQRLCQFHGVNIVVKGEPWIPYPFDILAKDPSKQNINIFNTAFENSKQTKYSLVKKDLLLLQEHGINCIRLGVMMPAVYPEDPNQNPENPIINKSYLFAINKLMQIAANYGIYVVLDLHQDLLSSVFCGEGLPIWFVKNYLLDTSKPWPYPLAGAIMTPLWNELKKLISNVATLPPIPIPLTGTEKCPTNWWAGSPNRFKPTYPIDKQCSCAAKQPPPTNNQVLYGAWQLLEAFERLYANYAGFIAQFWIDVLDNVDTNLVLCIDIINEPLFGNAYKYLFKAINGNNNYLYPFYNTVISQIQARFENVLISFEPITFTPPLPGFSKAPIGKNLIYNRHYYSGINGNDVNTYLNNEYQWAQKNKVGFILSEFLSPGYSSTLYSAIASYCDENFIPFMWWEFKSFTSNCNCSPWNYGITGYGGGMFLQPEPAIPCSTQCPTNNITPAPYEIVESSPKWNKTFSPIHKPGRSLFSHYPVKVAGTNVTYNSNPFTLSFTAAKTGTTEIFIPTNEIKGINVLNNGQIISHTTNNNIIGIQITPNTQATITFAKSLKDNKELYILLMLIYIFI